MSPVLGIIASSTQQGRGGGPIGAYDALATAIVPSGGVASVNFAGIPSDYQHLQIRILVRTAWAATFASAEIQFNSDTGTSYDWHYVTGNGTGASAGAATSDNFIRAINLIGASQIANTFSIYTLDVLDYKNTNKFTTARILGGGDANGSGSLNLTGGLWRNLSAVTSIKLTASNSANFVENTSFALYGVK
jgi:hypothetical protein